MRVNFDLNFIKNAKNINQEGDFTSAVDTSLNIFNTKSEQMSKCNTKLVTFPHNYVL